VKNAPVRHDAPLAQLHETRGFMQAVRTLRIGQIDLVDVVGDRFYDIGDIARVGVVIFANAGCAIHQIVARFDVCSTESLADHIHIDLSVGLDCVANHFERFDRKQIRRAPTQ
jgi:hypothetical protein